MTDRRKPTAGFWTTAVLVAVLVGYPLSFGPACRLAQRKSLPEPIFIAGYRPCIWIAHYGRGPVQRAAWKWAKTCGGAYELEDVSLGE